MADALVGATIQVLLEKVFSLIAIDRFGLAFGFQQDLERLKESAEMIRDFLADAEDKQTDRQAVRRWLKRLEGVALDAYYVLDELNYEILRRKVKSKVCSFFFFTKDDILFRWRMAPQVREIDNKLKNINQQATEFGLNRVAPPPCPPSTAVSMSRQTDSIAAPYVVGRDTDESKIVEMMLSYSEQVVSVIPIVGMGGLGKTTLAKSIYNRKQIEGHFSKRIWICVSENFVVVQLFKLILGSLWRTKVEMLSRDDIVQKIRKELDGKRYLLVLDDVWNDSQQLWDDFCASLVGLSTATGSMCLVTTRLGTVASIVSRDPPYELGKLSDDDTWCIIRERVIGSGEIPQELSEIRMQIIRKCDGLPLAANVIGGLLGRQRKEYWQSIAENRLLSIDGDQGSSIMQILKLSFDYLPFPSIKKCFAHCSLFAKDAWMDRDELIELWMAEGFLQSNLQNETTMEEIGDQYFNILLQSSLLEEVKYFWQRNYYKMHDLVHDLALSISKLQHFNSENNVTSYSHHVRSLAIATSGDIMTLTGAPILERSSIDMKLTISSALEISKICKEMLRKFKHLHTLNLSNANITVLPSSIGKLKHLRFLRTPDTEIKCLPESICKLFNLQTLRIKRFLNEDAFPEEMSNLISLRHLHYFTTKGSFKMALKMGRLSCLQTLQFFNVSQESGRKIEELASLKDLKGKLTIRNLELAKDKEEATRANLYEKQSLLDLTFSWCIGRGEEGVEICDEHVLEGLEPHPNLKVLTIEYFMGGRFPQWLVNLSKLEELNLQGCNRCTEPPTLGHLPCLRNLILEMENVSCIGVSFYGFDDWRGGSGSNSSWGGVHQVPVSRKIFFPALKVLNLESMRSLIEWKEAEADDDDAAFPLLEDLTIENWYGHLTGLTTAPSHFPSLQNLSIVGNGQVSAVSSILSKATTTLRSLSLCRVDGLTSISHAMWSCCTSLESLKLSNCLNLMELPDYLFQLRSLRSLQIDNCPKILRLGPPPPPHATKLTSLKKFRVSGCKGLIGIASEVLECCTSLTQLQVCDCPNLSSFPIDLGQTPNISTINLGRCPKLFADKNNMPKGFGHLTNLETMNIGPLSNDDYSIELFDWSGLICCSATLWSLRLYGMPDKESLLPDQFQRFTKLWNLCLEEFGLLESLPDWLGKLESLETLQVRDCQNLRYLPSMLAMTRLTELRAVEIFRCPLLRERCRPHGGPDSEWSKISQLPNINFSFDG